jgi:hypothetical protein
MRSSFVRDAFPRQPQLAFVQATSSSPNISIALSSETGVLVDFF